MIRINTLFKFCSTLYVMIHFENGVPVARKELTGSSFNGDCKYCPLKFATFWVCIATCQAKKGCRLTKEVLSGSLFS